MTWELDSLLAALGRTLAIGGPGVLLWPALVGVGVYLIATGQQVILRPKADLAERLRRMDVRVLLRETQAHRRPGAGTHRGRMFHSPLLEQLLRPGLEALGRGLQAVFEHVGLGHDAGLQKQLDLVRPGVTVAQFYAERAAVGLGGLLFFPVLAALGLRPFPYPPWLWLALGVPAFLWPSLDLRRRARARRERVVLELAPVLDLLVIALAAGTSPEQAFAYVAATAEGILAEELRQAMRAVALGQEPDLIVALEHMAERNDVDALLVLVGQLRGTYREGDRVLTVLESGAEELREQERLRLVAESGRAMVRMVLPIALCILPVLFVVVLVPAGAQLLQVSGL